LNKKKIHKLIKLKKENNVNNDEININLDKKDKGEFEDFRRTADSDNV